METKNIIYLGILTVSLFIAVLLLSLYYAQELEEEYHLVPIMEFGKINYTIENDYIQAANVEIGELKLRTKGTFTKDYKFPALIGCIKQKVDGEYKFVNQKIQFQFTQEELPAVKRYRRLDYYYGEPQETKIEPGKEQTYKIVGSIWGKYSEYFEDPIVSLVLYKTEQKEGNPFDFDYSRYNELMNKPCETLENTEDPYREIPTN